MAFTPNFASNANWQLIANDSVTAHTFTVNNVLKHDPISPIFVNDVIANTAIAITVITNVYDKPSWTYGGEAEISLQSSAFPNYPIIAKSKLSKNQTTIITFPFFGTNYRLRLIPPSWFWNFNYLVYGYIGNGYPDNSQKLDRLGQILDI